MEKPQSPIHIKHEGSKFYARLLTKESSVTSNPSFRYYGSVVPGSVPFLWEIQPGTPKVAVAGITVPPITPPPSYQYPCNGKNARKKRGRIRCIRRIISVNVAAVFRRFRLKKLGKNGMSSSGNSSVSGSSRWLFSVPGSTGDHGDSTQYNGSSPPRATACFTMRRAPRFFLFCYHS